MYILPSVCAKESEKEEENGKEGRGQGEGKRVGKRIIGRRCVYTHSHVYMSGQRRRQTRRRWRREDEFRKRVPWIFSGNKHCVELVYDKTKTGRLCEKPLIKPRVSGKGSKRF